MWRDVSDDHAEGVPLNPQTRAVTGFFAVLALLGLLFEVFNVHQAGRVVEGRPAAW